MTGVAADPLLAVAQLCRIVSTLQQASLAAGIGDAECKAMCACVRDRAILISDLVDITLQYPNEHKELAVSLHRCLWAAVHDVGEGLDSLYNCMSARISFFLARSTEATLRTTQKFLSERVATLESYISLVALQDRFRSISRSAAGIELAEQLQSVGHMGCDQTRMTHVRNFAAISRARSQSRGQTMQLRTHEMSSAINAYRLAVSPDGKQFATCGSRGHVRVWDAATGSHVRACEGHTAFVYSVSWSPDSKLLASASKDCSARIWNVETGVQVCVLEGMWQTSTSTPVHDVSWSRDCKRILTTSPNNSASVWHVHNGNESSEPELMLAGHQTPICTVDWSPDDTHLATGAQDGSVALWSSRTGARHSMCHNHQQPVGCVCFCVGGQSLVSASQDGLMIVWDVSGDDTADKLKVRAKVKTSQSMITSLDWSPCGRWIVTATWRNNVYLWNATTLQREIEVTDAGDTVTGAVRYSPCGRYIFLAKNNETVVVHRLVMR